MRPSSTQGTVTVREGGLAVLVAPQVTNAGIITAKAGRVALGAGEVFTVDLYGDGLVSLAASDRLREAVVDQKGGIRAEGGLVVLTTAQARGIVDEAVNMNGWVDVSSLTKDAGGIVLHAAQGTTTVKGKLHADGAVGTGGKVQVTGKDVKIGAGAALTAMGTYGGGEIKIGGDYLGGTTPRAKSTRIEAGAAIDASATGAGKGGRVIAWSDERTDFGGAIHAKGGLWGGNGGFVETSSKETLSVTGLVDASSLYGKGGEWLLDPNDVTINATADANVAGSPNFTTTDDNAVVTVASIQTALNAGTSVSIITGTAGANTQNGDITVANSIAKTAGGDATLTLKAHRNITVNDGVNITSNTGELHMVFHADADAVPNQDGAIYLGSGNYTTNGGDFTAGGGVNPATTAAFGNAGEKRGIRLNGAIINAGGGNISMRGNGHTGSGADAQGVYALNSIVQTSGNGTITLNGTGGGDGTGTDNYGVYVSSSSFITVDGLNSVTGIGGSGTNLNNGVRLVTAGSAIKATGSGNVSVTGTAHGTGIQNFGVSVLPGTEISVATGTATVQGTGSTTGTASDSGVYVTGANAAIKATGSGNVSVTGNGGGTGIQNSGVYLESGGAISVVDGTATVEGTGSATGSVANIGVYAWAASSAIQATGSGNVSVTGTGGGTANFNNGVRLEASGKISVVDGTATITGTGSNGTSDNSGIYLTGAGTQITTVNGDIDLTGTGGNGSSLSNSGIDLLTGAVITSTGVGAGAGTITLDGTGGAGTRNNYGINVSGAGAQISSGYGDILITGAAGGNGTHVENFGIFVSGTADILSTGTGADAATVTLHGTGGSGAGNDHGIYLANAGTTISSIEGAVDLTGIGGNSTVCCNYGIYLANAAVISSTGTGTNAATLDLDGTGGVSPSVNYGLYLIDAGTNVTSVDGDIHLIGQGGGNGTNIQNMGIFMHTSAAVTSTGTGANAADILLEGTGGSGTGLDNGIQLRDLPQITAVDGNIDLFGTSPNAGSFGIDFLDGATVRITGGGDIHFTGTSAATDIYLAPAIAHTIGHAAMQGDITFTADDISFSNLTATTAGNIAFEPYTANTTIGVAGGAGTLDVSTTVLGFLNWGDTLRLGRGDGNGALTNLDDFTLTTNVDQVIGAGITGSGTLTLATTSVGTTLGLAGGAGTVNYSAADLANLGSGWSGWDIGGAAHTGALTVATRAWSDPVTFLAAPAGSIVISGAQTAGVGSDTIFTFDGPATINAALDLTNATAGTKDITFNDSAVVTGNITSAGGDVDFGDTLSLGAAISTAGGDITLADDVTLTANSSINTGTTDIDFGGMLDGAFDLALTTTGDIDFTEDVGSATPMEDITIANAQDVTLSGSLEAASLTRTAGTGAHQVTGIVDVSGNVSIATTGNVTFGDDVTYGGDFSADAGAGDIAFNTTLDGAGDLTLTTTGDITFADDVGGVTPLGDVVIDPHDFIAGGSFNAASFTLTNGTGLVNFSAGAGLTATGNISIATNGNILGTYTGVNGVLDAGAGNITATVSFATLDIDGAAATLSAGYIGTPGPVTQTMVNRISIDGQRHPWPASIPNDNFTFASLYIGGSGSSGGGESTPPSAQPPVTDPGSSQPPVTPPPANPGHDPAPPVSTTFSLEVVSHEVSRIQRTVEEKTLPAETERSAQVFFDRQEHQKSLYSLSIGLLTEMGCDSSSANASCGTLLQFQ